MKTSFCVKTKLRKKTRFFNIIFFSLRTFSAPCQRPFTSTMKFELNVIYFDCRYGTSESVLVLCSPLGDMMMNIYVHIATVSRFRKILEMCRVLFFKPLFYFIINFITRCIIHTLAVILFSNIALNEMRPVTLSSLF